jgi:hypothetical protein
LLLVSRTRAEGQATPYEVASFACARESGGAHVTNDERGQRELTAAA